MSLKTASKREFSVKPVYGNYCNTYVVNVCGKVIIVDAGAPVDLLKVNEVDYIFLTHAHYDHFCYLNDYLEAFSGVRVLMSKNAYDKIENPHLTVARDFFGVEHLHFDKSRFFQVDSNTKLNGLDVRFIDLKGHTDCSLGMLVGECLFCGDAYFSNGFGRYDLPTGSFEHTAQTVQKIEKMRTLKCIYPGHGDIIYRGL